MNSRASAARRLLTSEFSRSIATNSTPGRLSRSALLAGASLLALAALATPGAARAACAPSPQTISKGVAGPVFSNGGSILVTGGGSIAGGREGVFAKNCSITTLLNEGSIGAASGAPGAAGGIGVRSNSSQTINLLTNATGATISGGAGGSGSTAGSGGAGVLNAGTITTLKQQRRDRGRQRRQRLASRAARAARAFGIPARSGR